MDKKGVAILLIALVMAVAAGASVYLYLEDISLAQGNDTDLVPVVVARKDMTFGTTLEPEHLRVVQFGSHTFVFDHLYGVVFLVHAGGRDDLFVQPFRCGIGCPAVALFGEGVQLLSRDGIFFSDKLSALALAHQFKALEELRV